MFNYNTKSFDLVVYVSCLAVMVFTFINNESSAEMTEGKSGLSATVLLYSGMPDPTFSIVDDTKIKHIKNLLDKAPKNEKHPKGKSVLPSILGYKGIVVMNSGNIPDFPEYIAVYNGNMEVRNKDKAYLVDKDNTLEKFVLELAKESKALTNKELEIIKERAE